MQSIRELYEDQGVSEFYAKGEYENQHKALVQNFVRTRCSKYTRVLDLACGNGEVTSALPLTTEVIGCDPFLSASYIEKTSRKCFTQSFEEIAQDGFPEQNFDAIICSFALHLAPPSIMSTLLYQLSRISPCLIVISPSKLPLIDEWMWRMDEHTIMSRVHFRRFVKA